MARIRREWWTLLAALVVGAMALLTTRQASAQPSYQGTGLEVQVQILQLADARAQPLASAPVLGSFLPGELVFLIDGVRDATGARWLQVGRGDASLVGWIPQAAGNILGSGATGAQLSAGSRFVVTPFGVVPIGPVPLFPFR